MARIEIGKHNYLLFDGDCGICTYLAKVAERIDRRNLFVITPYQSISEDELRRYGIDYEQCHKQLQVITYRRRVHSNAFAVNYFLSQFFPWTLLVILIYAIPIFLLCEVIIYRLVARYRQHISQWLGLKACSLKQ